MNKCQTYSGRDLLSEKVKICNRCIFDSSLSGISFGEDGVCSYCKMVESLAIQYGTGTERGKLAFENIVNKIKKDGYKKNMM